MTEFSFTEKERIKKKVDFLNVYKHGCKLQSTHFRIAFAGNTKQHTRLGITISKKAGNAVNRNYVKRQIREFFRLNKKLFPTGSDVVITAKPGAANIKQSEIQEELKNIFPVDHKCR